MDINLIMVFGSFLLLISALTIDHISCWKEYIKACRRIKVGGVYKRRPGSRFRLTEGGMFFRLTDIKINSLMKVIIVFEHVGFNEDRIVKSFGSFLEDFEPLE